jgi:uncharacterized protein (TIGR00730 family)
MAEKGKEIAPGVDRDTAVQIWRDSILKLWEVVDDMTRLRPTHTPHYSVTVFGSARLAPETPHYDAVRRLAHDLAAMGCRVVTGGGPGLMQAANEGAWEVSPESKESVGVRIHLPFEQSANPFVGQVYEHRTFFSRLHHFVLRSNAFVAVPGGIGTVLEVMMIWQLLQVSPMDSPLILVGKMWPGLVEWATQEMTETPFRLADPADMKIPQCVPDADSAIALIRPHYATWQAESEVRTTA